MTLLFGFLFLGSLGVIYLDSSGFDLFFIYSIFIIVTVYPSLAALMIYISSFKYLRAQNNDSTKKAVFNSLTFGTVGLASTFVLAILFILAFLSPFVILPLWGYYILVLSIYICVFLLGVYLPYYQSMEELKQIKLKDLQALRQKLIDKINDNNVHEHVAIELHIQRIDREIDTASSKSSHPYSIMKSLGAFVVVVVLGGMLANLLGEVIKVLLNIT
jgi:hypothetical protein